MYVHVQCTNVIDGKISCVGDLDLRICGLHEVGKLFAVPALLASHP